MTKIFLSGGITNMNPIEASDWRTHVVDYLHDAVGGEIECFNPVWHFNFFGEKTWKTDREIMEFELANLRKCDVVVYNANDPTSLGSMAELAIAHDRNKPIYILNEEKKELHPWIRDFALREFEDREELLVYLVIHYGA